MSADFGPLVSAEWLRTHSDAPDIAVVDVRFNLLDPASGPASYLEGHLPGAVFANTDRDLSAAKTGTNGRHPMPSPDRCAEVFGRLGIGPGTRVVAYDDAAGLFAARLWWMLRSLGHRAVALLDGGLPAWIAAGGELRSGEETRTPQTFVPRPVPEMEVPVDAVAAGLAEREHLLLDAREPERFRGETEPLDPVAGRIPGARNHLWRKNLTEDGCFLDTDTLRERLAPVANATNGRRIVCYCGSGLSAAHNALALTLAGVDGVSVYSGSWSEWCADPARPQERGAA